jgi:membrane peptidoglycan carboxypeptidase
MPRWMMALLVLSGLAVFAVGAMVAIGFGMYQSYADDLVPPDEKIAQLPRGGALVLDRNGTPMYEFLDENYGLREPVDIDEISPWLVFATVAWEDTSFFDNPGVNFKGLANAAWDNFWPFSGDILEGRGGSSITQQLVKNVYFTQEERADRSIERKLKETVYALELTKQNPGLEGKRQIMEWYLNSISYGNVYIGVEKAAEGYFGKDANELTIAEAALLAGIPTCPTCYDPINAPESALAQRNRVLKRMYEEKYIDGGQLWEAASQSLQLAPTRFNVEAPHFVFNVVKPQLEALFGEEAVRRDGLVVYTTLDLDWQNRAQEILENWITTYEGTAGGHNGAAVAIDPKTAEVIVYIGSRDYFDESILGQNDMAQALNSPGSSFKPFTYLTAFMNLGWGPGTLILDEQIASKYWDGANPPRNPVAHSGPITARQALGNSLNIPAVKTILYTGVEEVVQQGKKMGITSFDGRDLGPSLTVGGVDVKLIDMVYGYTAFPNLGMLRGIQTTEERPPGNRSLDPISILRVEDRDGNILYPMVDGVPSEQPVVQEERVAPAGESYLINSILSDPQAHCLTYGCGGLTIPGRPIGMKTGTSEPYEQIGLIGETWNYGYTPQLVFGTWFGNADNTPMRGITSYNVSANTTRDFMIAYHEGLPVESFAQPEGLVRARACVPSGLRPTETCPLTTPDDWFAKPLAGDDTWWRMERIDIRTGRPATDSTPARFVRTGRTLVLPDGLTEFQREEALAWQAVANRSPNNSDDDDDNDDDEGSAAAAIRSPSEGDPVRGLVNVMGTADSEDFTVYRLEYEYASNPNSWTLIAEGGTTIANGALGLWDTTGLVPGIYTLRLTVVDASSGSATDRVRVLVISSEGIEPTPGIEAAPGRGRGPPAR